MKFFKDNECVCVSEESVPELVDCLDEQIAYIKGLYPGSFEEWNENNCLNFLATIEEKIAELGVNKKTQTLIQIENWIVELLHKADINNVVIVEPNETGEYRINRKHLLKLGFTPEEIDDLARTLLED